MQLKAVILDYGNVLSAPQDYAAVEAMAAVFGVPVAAFERAYWQDRAAFDDLARRFPDRTSGERFGVQRKG